MEYTNLGRTGLKVSRLCLGTMNLFPAFIGREASFEIYDKAIEVGINFFDTANVYGDYFDPKAVGGVETLLEVVGRDLAKRDYCTSDEGVWHDGEGMNRSDYRHAASPGLRASRRGCKQTISIYTDFLSTVGRPGRIWQVYWSGKESSLCGWQYLLVGILPKQATEEAFSRACIRTASIT
jgi:hypothetical protein